MWVELAKVLPSRELQTVRISIEKRGDRFRLVQRGRDEPLSEGKRSDALAQLEGYTRNLLRRGYQVAGGDKSFRRLFPGYFQVELSPEVREALLDAGLPQSAGPAVVRPQVPLTVGRKPGSRTEALRLGVE